MDTTTDLKETIMDLIEDNNENLMYHQNGYEKGYAEGYHDALVDLMNKLGIDHDEEFYN